MGDVQGDQGGHVSYLGLTGGQQGGKDQGKSSHGRQAMTLPGATTLQVSQMCSKGDYSPASLQSNTGVWLLCNLDLTSVCRQGIFLYDICDLVREA